MFEWCCIYIRMFYLHDALPNQVNIFSMSLKTKVTPSNIKHANENNNDSSAIMIEYESEDCRNYTSLWIKVISWISNIA